MKVIYHLGVHGTDQDRIVSTLLQNQDPLSGFGIKVPAPDTYRDAISQVMVKMRNQEITTDIQDGMMEMVTQSRDDIERLVLSHDNFMGLPGQAVGDDVFYPMLVGKIRRLQSMFGAHEVEFCLGLCNPAVFIPEIFARAKESDFQTFLKGSDPMHLRWSEMVARLKATVPNCKITVWANEDTPFTWPEVVRAVSGHPQKVVLEGMDDFYEAFVSPGGLRRMSNYLRTHPPETREAYMKIVEMFLEKFGQEDMVETEIDLPGWGEPYVEALSTLYDQDLRVIAGMSGITYITP